MLSFKELNEKKTKVKINPNLKDVMEKSDSDCDCDTHESHDNCGDDCNCNSVTEQKKKKDDTYLETDFKKRLKNNEKARKELMKGPQMKNPHLESFNNFQEQKKKKKTHNCASKVKHEEYGIGKCISGMHDLDESGNVAHYDVEFDDLIAKNVPVKDLEILVTEMHEHVIHKESVQNGKVDLVLKKGVNNVLKQDNEEYDRGLLAQVNEDGSYDVAYWYDQYKAYPVEVVIDGKSCAKEAKNIHIKFHPELKEATRLKKEKGYDKGGTKKPSAKKDKALSFVLDKIRKEHGKGAVMTGGSRQQKKVKGAKSDAGTGKYKKAADAKKQTAADAKKRGFKDVKNYVNTMARYGGKSNYDKGKGLGT